jgi:probable rRNA maturation factor
MPVEVNLEDPRWGDLAPLAEATVAAVLQHLRHDPDAFEVSVLACDDARIRALNAEFRGQDRPTNVLSWPAEDLSDEAEGAAPAPPERGTPEDPAGLGDIALAFETCAREADEQGKRLPDHAAHLLVHSVLHLLGYDHARAGDALLMEETEIAILADMGIANPYEALDGPVDAAGP